MGVRRGVLHSPENISVGNLLDTAKNQTLYEYVTFIDPYHLPKR